MANNDLVKFFNLMFDKRQKFEISEGILQDLRGLTGKVSFVGNPMTQEVYVMQGALVSVGNRCLCIRPTTSSRWVVMGSFGTRQTGYLPSTKPEDAYQVFPPSSLTAEDILPGCCLWHWAAPAEKAVVFEVQTNTTADETGATTQLRTRGSYYIIASEDNLFMRVRSITSTYNFSSWSSWVECAPGAAGGGSGTVTSVAIAVPSELSVAGSPITTTGTFTVTWANQSANKLFAGPVSGGAAAPAFRDQVLSDSPTISSNRLIGRYSSGSGKYEELALGANLYISSGTLNASGASGGGGGSIDTSDGTTTVSPTSLLSFDPTDFLVTDGGSGEAQVSFVGSGGSGAGSAYIDHEYIGTTAIGASDFQVSVYTTAAKKITITDSGMIASINAYIKSHAPGSVSSFTMGVWDDNAGVPGKLISLVPPVTNYDVYIDNGYQWMTIPIGLYVTPGSYWIGIYSGLSSGAGYDIAYDTTGGVYATWSTGNNWISHGSAYSVTTGVYNLSINASFIKADGAVPGVYPQRFEIFPWEFTIGGSTTTFGKFKDSAQYYDFLFYQDGATANGDWFEFSCLLEAGEYTIYHLTQNDTYRGILDWYVDGVVEATVDHYGSFAKNIIKTCDVTVVGDGRHIFRGQINGKNASALSYNWAATKLWIVKTGSETTAIAASGGGIDINLILEYEATTDIANGTALTINTWTTVSPNESFTVNSAESNLQISTLGQYIVGPSGGHVGARLVIDEAGTPIYIRLGGGFSGSSYNNPLSGVDAVWTQLSAGSHTVALQLNSDTASNVAYCRPLTYPDVENLKITIAEFMSYTGTLPAVIQPNKLIGRYSATEGDFEELAIGAGLYISSDTLYASGSSGPTDEYIQDLVAALIVAGSNVSATYNDGANTLTLAVTGLTSAQISDFSEAVDDRVAAFLVAGSNISLTYNDVANTLTIDFSGTLATSVLTGTLQAAQFPALTGDVTTVAGALATTLATVNSNVGAFALPSITVNAKGLVTAATAAATTGSGDVVLKTSPTIITPTIASLTNAQHNHTNAAGGGQITDAALSAPVTASKGGLNVDASAFSGLIKMASGTASVATPDVDYYATAEAVQDMIAAFVVAGANISATYNDGANTLTFAVTGLTSAQISDFTEASQDSVASMLTAGSNVTLTYNDAANTLTIAFSGTLATSVLTGTLLAAQFPALTGDITTIAGALATTLATVNANVGTYALANITVNGKGLITAASAAGTTGSGDVVLANSPAIATPTIASFANANHNHSNSAGGGTLAASAIGSGQLALARGGTNADLSATGGSNQVLRQSSAGAAVTVSVLADADIPDALTISGGTVNNTPVGATTPSSGKFTTLEATGAVDLNAATSLRVPVNTSAVPSNTGSIVFNPTYERVFSRNSVRAEIVDHSGYALNAFPAIYDAGGTYLTASATLAAVTGTMIIPMFVPSHMLFYEVAILNMDASGTRTWAWDLYVDRANNSNTLDRITGSSATVNLTASGGVTSTAQVQAGGIVYLGPGIYFLAIQNRHATNTFTLGVQAQGVHGGQGSAHKIKTTSGINGSTLDIIAATWTGYSTMVAARLKGFIAGTSSQW